MPTGFCLLLIFFFNLCQQADSALLHKFGQAGGINKGILVAFYQLLVFLGGLILSHVVAQINIDF